MELRKFIKKAKNIKCLQDIYKCMFFRRISSQGAITELLPIVLFLRLGNELNLGTYNSLFAVISIFSLRVLKLINKRKIKKGFYPYLAIAIFISSVAVVYNASFTTLLIYYILMNSFGTIIESESCSMVYAAIKVDGLVKYKKEHICTYSISILMFFLIISTIYLEKTEKQLKNTN